MFCGKAKLTRDASLLGDGTLGKAARLGVFDGPASSIGSSCVLVLFTMEDCDVKTKVGGRVCE